MDRHAIAVALARDDGERAVIASEAIYSLSLRASKASVAIYFYSLA
ncbi:hypothetical protein [Helicobacter zhangjianzhongii]|uniref:Uncharacterized protein n=1 Tax=Helicobacter zhangjianzhongii TaxID=2974574 RepID=A0ACC6FUW5_9HELI|nr:MULTISPECIES: hypothetical protein [unclassified Helicobacter]MDL0080773.1 hypothetical protein [Helicobacter sp. CPD2-1]MDL0082702.1 hypothetical protein [Helicobacter sp. XJK30-2]